MDSALRPFLCIERKVDWRWTWLLTVVLSVVECWRYYGNCFAYRLVVLHHYSSPLEALFGRLRFFRDGRILVEGATSPVVADKVSIAS